MNTQGKTRLTLADIDAAQSSYGGWSKKQFELVGVEWPPQKGWKKRIKYQLMEQSTINQFISLKDKHL